MSAPRLILATNIPDAVALSCFRCWARDLPRWVAVADTAEAIAAIPAGSLVRADFEFREGSRSVQEWAWIARKDRRDFRFFGPDDQGRIDEWVARRDGAAQPPAPAADLPLSQRWT